HVQPFRTRPGQAQEKSCGGQGEQAEGNVDPERPTPADPFGEPAAEERSGNRGDCEYRSDEPGQPAALPVRAGCGAAARGMGRLSAAAGQARKARGNFVPYRPRPPVPSGNPPPEKGTATGEAPEYAPEDPAYLPRCLAGTMSAMMAWDMIIRPPPPSPCTTRP